MKKIKAISFDNAQEINTLVHVLSQYIDNNNYMVVMTMSKNFFQ